MFSKKLMKITVILMIVWFTINVIYYGIMFCLPSAIVAIKAKTNNKSLDIEENFKDIAISITPEFGSYIAGIIFYFFFKN